MKKRGRRRREGNGRQNDTNKGASPSLISAAECFIIFRLGIVLKVGIVWSSSGSPSYNQLRDPE